MLRFEGSISSNPKRSVGIDCALARQFDGTSTPQQRCPRGVVGSGLVSLMRRSAENNLSAYFVIFGKDRPHFLRGLWIYLRIRHVYSTAHSYTIHSVLFRVIYTSVSNRNNQCFPTLFNLYLYTEFTLSQ